jgi:hypothetical protein
MQVRERQRMVPEGWLALPLSLGDLLVDIGRLLESLLTERSLGSRPLGLEI